MAIEPLMPMELGSPTTATMHRAPESTSSQKRHHEYQLPASQHKSDISLSLSSPPDSPTTTSPPRARRRSHSVDRTSVQLLAHTSSRSSLGGSTRSGSGSNSSKSGLRAKLGLGGVARRTLGITLLLLTVFLWTLSNFLASVCGPLPPPR